MEGDGRRLKAMRAGGEPEADDRARGAGSPQPAAGGNETTRGLLAAPSTNRGVLGSVHDRYSY